MSFKILNMEFSNFTFKNKVARRILGLFLLSALVPLLITLYFSKSYLSNLLIDKGYSNLRNEARYYSQYLLERLYFIEMQLKNIATNSKEKDFNNVKNSKFISIKKETLKPQAKKTISTIFFKSDNNNQTKVFMTSYAAGSNIALTAEINPRYLWNQDDIYNPDINICIANEAGISIHCDSSLPQPIIENNTPRTFTNKKYEPWTNNNKNYISSSKILFLKVNFNSENWKIIVTQSEKNILEPADTFNTLFTTIIALTLLIILFISIKQIKRSMMPLEKLIQGTRHIANRRFDERVELTKKDEFFELAQSFNSMANRLKQQFATFSILSEIDKLILTNSNNEEVYLTVLKYIQNIIPCDIASITVIDSDTDNYGKTYVSKNTKVITHKSTRIILSDESLNQLNDPEQHELMLKNADENHFLHYIKHYNIKNICIYPIYIKEKISTIITLGFYQKPKLNNESDNLLTDIADRISVALSAIEYDKKLYQQSYYDSLTKLPNRQLMSLRLEQEILYCQRNNRSIAVLFLDLDRFKQVNDTLGHTLGDELLKKVAVRLNSCIRETDTVARLGGDEFTIMLTGSITQIDINTMAKKIIKNFDSPFNIDSHEIFIGTSMGISIYPNDGKTVTALLKNADTAMYRAKENDKGSYLFFEEKMNLEEVARAKLERDLRYALKLNQFILLYQPLVDVNTQKIIGAEALLRWNHPQHGLVSPDSFIPLAEETGLIQEIGNWVIHTACKQLRTWLDNNVKIERLAINISCRQFTQENFSEILSNIIKETNVPAEKLEFEITESMLMDKKVDELDILNKLHRQNINLSIDDFGTGFSSLSYLNRFPLNTLKIDRSFIEKTSTNSDSKTIIKSIITLAHSLNLDVIAEGIESEEQLNLIKKYKCKHAQGFYFSSALNTDDFESYYQQQNMRKI